MLGTFQEEFEGFEQVFPRFLDRITLACDIELGAERNEAVTSR